MENNETKEIKKTKNPSGKQQAVRIVMGVVGIALMIWILSIIVNMFLDQSKYEESDDAQVEQYISPVNIRATGYIQKICFKEYDYVHKGDTLLILDDREYRIRVTEAEAALKDAQAGAHVLGATIDRTRSSADAIDPSITELETRITQMEKNVTRYRNLVSKKAATVYQLEQMETELTALREKLTALNKQKQAAMTGVSEVSRRMDNTSAAIQRTEAALEMARLNLSYTVVTAPYDGQLGRRAIEEGQYINAGTAITYIIPKSKKWVVANYKEKQLQNLYLGQEVILTVDALGDKEFHGKVTAFSGATGSKYSLVPTDNSAGNFVKIQQRLPVRIDFTDLSDEDNKKLAAGMMVVVKAKR